MRIVCAMSHRQEQDQALPSKAKTSCRSPILQPTLSRASYSYRSSWIVVLSCQYIMREQDRSPPRQAGAWRPSSGSLARRFLFQEYEIPPRRRRVGSPR